MTQQLRLLYSFSIVELKSAQSQLATMVTSYYVIVTSLLGSANNKKVEHGLFKNIQGPNEPQAYKYRKSYKVDDRHRLLDPTTTYYYVFL